MQPSRSAADAGRVVLSRAAPAAAGRRPVRTWRVFAQVGAAAAVVLALVAVLGLGAARRIAEQESVNDAARSTDLLADAVVQPALTDALLTGDPDAVAALDAVVRERVLGPAVLRVKLWDADGRIVYSDAPELIGEVFPLGDDETAVLAQPATKAEVSDLDEPENRLERDEGRLLEVYRPVWTPDGTVLLFETYSRYDVVSDRAAAVWRGFAAVTLTSLLLFVVLLLPVLWTLLDRLRRAQQQREELLQQAVDASDAERRRIAATLHDGVVQELVAASFALSGAADEADRSGSRGTAELIRGSAETVRTSIRGLRSLLVAIYPDSLRSAGLAAALTDLVGGLASRGVRVELDVPDEGVAGTAPEVEQLVYRVAQETVRNAVAHAGADLVRVRLSRGDGTVVLEVEDDGTGFDVRAALDAPVEGHFGLRLLRDLATASGADLSVESAAGRGTRWRLTVREDDAR
ncbi:sensor histidine kinase [Cellulomonas endometrii]|uniref:sensor histidine kinase n=1 Tax=Cellulomonas endometrii TaxID=3036301 RepID=UPI0024AD6D7C|nr:ATP-binding protein [Cellulomonas endometrii]